MKIHFIGIEGIGVSALAGYYRQKGHQVSGSDIALAGHRSENLPKDTGLVIYSPAVLSNNPEIKEAKRRGIKIQSYPEALGELTEKYFTIAISGAHGKSTTTAMIALILIKAGLDPTVVIGTKLKEFGNKNFRTGKSKYLVIEADEWQASFLNYWPKIIVLTNIEREHLDYYKNLNHILRTFKKYIKHLSQNGLLILNKDDKNISKLPPSPRLRRAGKTQKFSIKQDEADKLRKILKIPGEHNVYNALAALAVARALKIPDKVSFKVLSKYKGAWRRFEIKKAKISNKKFTIISDYGHHPAEIKATLQAAREKFPKKQIWCVFQPHQYQRTFYLFNEFVDVFSRAPIDKLIITDIYDVAGREKKEIKKKVNSKKLIGAINKHWADYLAKEEIKNYLKNNLKGGEIVIIMGAGNIYKLTDDFSTR